MEPTKRRRTPNPRTLDAFLTTLRRHGVLHYRAGDMELHLAPKEADAGLDTAALAVAVASEFERQQASYGQ